jgi:hypothetical protein
VREVLPRLIAAADDPDKVRSTFVKWVNGRDEPSAMTDLMRVAGEIGGPAERTIAIEAVALRVLQLRPSTETAEEVLRSAEDMPMMAPHIAGLRHAFSLGPKPDRTTSVWLHTEEMLALMTRRGPQVALDHVALTGGLAATAGGRHPDEGNLRDTLAAFTASGGRPRLMRAKAQLDHPERPWRRVTFPAALTLGDLDLIFPALFGWPHDERHTFEPARPVDAAGPDDNRFHLDAELYRALPRPGAMLAYFRKLTAGKAPRHLVRLERVGPVEGVDPLEGPMPPPFCVAGAGAAPAVDGPLGTEQLTGPFDPDTINLNLAVVRLGAEYDTGDDEQDDGTSWDTSDD